MEPYDISKIFHDMELDLISSMKKSLSKGGTGDWQRQKLSNLASYKAANAKIVNSHNGSLGKEISNLLKESFIAGSKNTDNILKRASKLASDIADIAQIGSDSFFKINENRINSLIRSVSGDLSKAESAMLRQADDIYRQTIFKSQLNLNAGSLSLNQSIDMATKDFLDKGFNCITYKDGRKVNIASYAEMVLRTSSQRAVFTGEGSRRDEWGVHTVVVSAHNNSSDLCIPWQGKVFIDDVYSSGKKGEGDYPLLSTAMDNGLFHPSCRHNMGTYFEGINTLPEPVDSKEASRNYETEQRQRYMERQVRKYKRREVGSLDLQNIKGANDKVKEWQGNLRQHLNDNPQLSRQSWREQNKIPVDKEIDNGLGNKNKYIPIPGETIRHANIGDLTNPRNPKKVKPNEIRFKKGGHGEENISLLESIGIEYNIAKEYRNGVRTGNVPNHSARDKRTGTSQVWFPKNWTAIDIEKASEYVANIRDKDKYILEHNFDVTNGKLISIFKFSNCNEVTVGVCYDVNKKEITTIFPDEKQRLLEKR